MMVETSPRPRQRTLGPKRTLASILREKGVLESALAVDVVFEICDGLARAHAEGVVHGDLGAHCVRLAWPPDPVVGVGEVEIFSIGEDEDRISMITAGTGGWSMSKSATLAPEQRVVGRRVDARADVWAVGALLRTMLGGAPPRTLVPLVDACLADDPSERPQTIEEVGEKIASYASSPPDCYARLAHWRTTTQGRVAAAKAETTAAALALERLDQFALDRARGAREEHVVDVTDTNDVEDFEDVEDVGAAPAELSPLITPPPFTSPLATPIPIHPGFFAPAPESQPLPTPAPPSRPAEPGSAPPRRVGAAVGVLAAIACIVLGITMGFYATQGGTTTTVHSPENADPASARQAPAAAPTAEAKEEGVTTITPASLPEAIPTFTPASLPEARGRARR